MAQRTDLSTKFNGKVAEERRFHPDSFRLLGRANEELARRVPATKRKPGATAVYCRYSTEAQKENSIERQGGKCGCLNHIVLGRNDFTLYADRGISGAKIANRPGLLDLIEAIESGKFTDVIVEDFDRLSREVYDAAFLGKTLERNKVALHIVNVGRAIDKFELLEHAKRAEKDRQRRTELLTGGQVQLALAGGLPRGASFGYVESDKRGFPVIDEEGVAPGLRRMFELLLTNSDSKTARQLKREGYRCPNGTVNWTGGMVTQLRKKSVYCGWSEFLAKRSEFDSKGKRLVTRSEPDDIIRVFNKRYEIVTEELFKKVAAARTANYKIDGPLDKRRIAEEVWYGNPVCDCPGAPPDQRYHFCGPILRCSRHSNFGDCLCKDGPAVPLAEIEPSMLPVVSDALAPLLSDAELRDKLFDAIRRRADASEARREEFVARRADLDAQGEKLLDDALINVSDKRKQSRLARIDEEIEVLDQTIAAFPRVHVDHDDFEIATAGVREAFALLAERVPFAPESDAERKLVSIMRKLIRKTIVHRAGLPVHTIGVSFEISTDALLMTLEESEGAVVPTETVRKEIAVRRFFRAGSGPRRGLDELVDQGRYALTDEQWEHLKPQLPDMNDRSGNVLHWAPTRVVADALIFAMRTRCQLANLPEMFGPKLRVMSTVARLVRANGIETIVAVMDANFPGWTNGLHIEDFNREKGVMRRCPDAAITHRTMAARYVATGEFCLTDSQWDALADSIPASVVKGRGQASVTGRQILEALLIKMRSGVTYENLPEKLGPWRPLFAGAERLIRSGGWDAVRAILADRYPECLEGLDTDWIENRRMSLARKTAAALELRKLSVLTGAQIKSNVVEMVLKMEGGLQVIKGWVSNGLGRRYGGRFAKPSLVFGSESVFSRRRRVRKRSLIVDIVMAGRQSLAADGLTLFKKLADVDDILLVATDRMRIEHHRKREGRWTSKVLTERSGKINLISNGIVNVGDIYRDCKLKRSA